MIQIHSDKGRWFVRYWQSNPVLAHTFKEDGLTDDVKAWLYSNDKISMEYIHDQCRELNVRIYFSTRTNAENFIRTWVKPHKV